MHETKSISFEVKASDTEKNVIEGFASTFGNKDLVGDIVEKGAFAKTIKERGDRVVLLYGHNWDKVLGRVTYLEETDKGLYFKAKISETSLGKDVLVLIRDKVLKKLSIGYRTIDSKFDHIKKARILKQLELFEISVVVQPANEKAELAGIKANKESNRYANALDELASLLKHSSLKSSNKEKILGRLQELAKEK